MLVVILSIVVTFIAIPFGRKEGLPGWIAQVAVTVACLSLWGSLLLGFFRRLKD
jgi:hypothetical protein